MNRGADSERRRRPLDRREHSEKHRDQLESESVQLPAGLIGAWMKVADHDTAADPAQILELLRAVVDLHDFAVRQCIRDLCAYFVHLARRLDPDIGVRFASQGKSQELARIILATIDELTTTAHAELLAGGHPSASQLQERAQAHLAQRTDARIVRDPSDRSILSTPSPPKSLQVASPGASSTLSMRVGMH